MRPTCKSSIDSALPSVEQVREDLQALYDQDLYPTMDKSDALAKAELYLIQAPKARSDALTAINQVQSIEPVIAKYDELLRGKDRTEWNRINSMEPEGSESLLYHIADRIDASKPCEELKPLLVEESGALKGLVSQLSAGIKLSY